MLSSAYCYHVYCYYFEIVNQVFDNFKGLFILLQHVVSHRFYAAIGILELALVLKRMSEITKHHLNIKTHAKFYSADFCGQNEQNTIKNYGGLPIETI